MQESAQKLFIIVHYCYEVEKGRVNSGFVSTEKGEAEQTAFCCVSDGGTSP